MSDLWPEEIGQLNIKAPVALLKEQAGFLGQKTNNIVKADVIALKPPEPVSANEPAGLFTAIAQEQLFGGGKTRPGWFSYAFLLVAPILDNYRYHLFTITHPVELYPVEFHLDAGLEAELTRPKPPASKTPSKGRGRPFWTANSEQEFVRALREVLRAKKTAFLIQSMLSQSQSYKG